MRFNLLCVLLFLRCRKFVWSVSCEDHGDQGCLRAIRTDYYNNGSVEIGDDTLMSCGLEPDCSDSVSGNGWYLDGRSGELTEEYCY